MSPSRQIVVRLRPGSDGDATHVPPQGHHTQIDPPTLYLEKIGQKWMESRGEARPGFKYILEQLPYGYTLWQRPRTNTQFVDKYLFGHPAGKKFDSPNRFYPHFEYLMENNGDSMGCPCTVCSGSTGILPKSSSSSSQVRSAASSRPATPKEYSLSKFQAPQGPSIPRVIPPSMPLKGRSKLSVGMDTSRVDEEGTPDIYRNLVDKLRRYGAIDEVIEEPLSPDWRAEQECLPRLLNGLKQQELWVPRTGEIVLYIRDLPKDVDFLCNETTGEWQLYSERLDKFLGPPQWEAGLVGQRTAHIPSITDLANNDIEQDNVTYSGIRVEPIPDPNDDDKSMSKRYKYISLQQTRPLVLWRYLLHKVSQKDWHSTITNALTLTSTMSLMGKHRFRGTWPESRIYCHSLYLGSEMLAVGDTIRILPNSTQSVCTDIIVIKSIQLKWSDLDKASTNDYDDGEPYRSVVWIYGSAYTTDPSRSDKEWLSDVEVPRGAEGYASDWYPLHPPSKELAIPYTRILSRLYERNAMAYFLNSGPQDLPTLDVGREGLLEARNYSSEHDQRIVRAGKTWWWGDNRADALNLHTINGLDTANYDLERDMKEARKNIKRVVEAARVPAPSNAESSNDRKRNQAINLSDGEEDSFDEEVRQWTRIIDEGPKPNTKKAKVEVVIR